MLVRYIALVAFLWAVVVAVAVRSMPAQGRQGLGTHPAIAVCSVFGKRDCLDALKVVNCESRFNTDARNGQYLGLFQMGSWERHRFGHGPDAWSQARAAQRYFLATGRDWSPWSCTP